MRYVSQIIMLYTLNLYSVVCQLCLYKTGGKIYNLERNWLDTHICLSTEESIFSPVCLNKYVKYASRKGNQVAKGWREIQEILL